jgi:hypothetical protein
MYIFALRVVSKNARFDDEFISVANFEWFGFLVFKGFLMACFRNSKTEFCDPEIEGFHDLLFRGQCYK